MSSISKSAYSMTMTVAMIGMGLIANQAMAAENETPPPQDPVAVAAETATTMPAPVPGSFEAMDANADGGLVNDEIPGDHPLSKKFSKADTDKNGQLSKAEFDAYQAKTMKKG